MCSVTQRYNSKAIHHVTRKERMMSTRRLIVFKYSSSLVNAPAHQFFDAIKIEKNDKGKPARSFGDYTVTIDKSFIPQGVELIEML
ncbi:type I CRISPR-associated protein Cas7 [Lentimicrobium sp.]|uniref:type I CRISPR-associated protein Cas7 n=1 Tax=Lentimicrobium sp. TaxID=2034841 RepID=UPI00345E8CCF